jgi:hypothetical protein
MTTVKADERRRVTIPCAEPGQEFAWREAANGTVILRPIERVRPRRARKVTVGLVKRGGMLLADLPKGFKLDPDAISQAVREEREGEPE